MQLLNILKKLPEVTAEVLSAGTLVSEMQLLNMLFMFVADAVLNKGTVVNNEQPLNMVPMFVTAAVLNKGTVVRDEQF